MNIEELAAQLLKSWGNKTLEELRVQAERQPTNIAFEALRLEGGKRGIIIFCVADIDQIARFEEVFDLVDVEEEEDWNTLNLVELAGRTIMAGGFAFESLRDEYNRRKALALIAAEPCSIQMLETAFGLEP